MKAMVSSLSAIQRKRVGAAALLAVLLLPLTMVLVLKPVLSPALILLNSGGSSLPLALEEQKNTELVEATETIVFSQGFEDKLETQNTDSGEIVTSPLAANQHAEESEIGSKKGSFPQPHLEEHQEDKPAVTENQNKESKVVCDFSQERSDTCSMVGDVRVSGQSSTAILVSSSEPEGSPDGTKWKIRPYTRKWESSTMETIKELTLTLSADPQSAPHCNVNHSVPAVLFSTGGFLGNSFHDFTDVLIPLFITSRQFNGEVQFLVTDYNAQWLEKYKPILKHLTHYYPINMDNDEKVHCFREAHVGLESHKPLGIDSSRSPNEYSMRDFIKFLRMTFSLKREIVTRINVQSKKKPRLLILLRKGSRSFTNEGQIISMARRVGYKVITARPEDTRDLSHFAQIVNSCDVMMGVHGAGLTNMVFLPSNATVIQVIPWGAMKWACRNDFGDPAPDMGIKYLDYEIKEEESTLIDKYPRNHPVFKDPLSIHRQGFNAVWSIFLNEQKVKLDVRRTREVLLDVFHSLRQ